MEKWKRNKLMNQIHQEDKSAGRLVNLSAIEQLISSGADVNAKDAFGSTALMMASSNGQKAVVEMLISAGADVNERDNGGMTALHSTAENANVSIAEILISAGADLKIRNKEGMTALDLAKMWQGFRYPIVVALGG